MFRSLPVIVLCALLPASAMAADTLTLEAALREALEGNQEVINSELQKTAAEGGLVGAKAVFDPRLELFGEVGQNDSVQFFGAVPFELGTLSASGRSGVSGELETGTSYSLTGQYNFQDTVGDFGNCPPAGCKSVSNTPTIRASLSQDILRGYRTSYNRRQIIEAENSLAVADLQLIAQQQRTMRDVATSYWAWANAKENREISQRRVEVAIEALRVGRLQLTEGRIAPVDVSRLQTELVRAEKTLADSRQAEGEGADTLMTLIGRDPGLSIEPGTPLTESPAPDLNIADAMKAVVAGNLDLAVLRRQVEQATRSVKMSKHGMLPSLTLGANANFGRQTTEAEDLDGVVTEVAPTRNLGGNATFSIPLGNRAARGDYARSAATEAQRKNELAGQERTLAAQAAKQVRVINNAAEQVRLADQEVVLADQTLKAEEARANAGRAVQKDVLEARTALFNAQIQAAKARTDRQLALVELLLLQGNLSIESVVP